MPFKKYLFPKYNKMWSLNVGKDIYKQSSYPIIKGINQGVDKPETDYPAEESVDNRGKLHQFRVCLLFLL